MYVAQCGFSSVADVPCATPISVTRSYFRHVKREKRPQSDKYKCEKS